MSRATNTGVGWRSSALPACLGYKGYEKTVCTSINHVVCHGIPGERVLKDGDIVNVEVTEEPTDEKGTTKSTSVSTSSTAVTRNGVTETETITTETTVEVKDGVRPATTLVQ